MKHEHQCPGIKFSSARFNFCNSMSETHKIKILSSMWICLLH